MSANEELKTAKFTREVDGQELTAEISPCVWMYPDYGLQIRVGLKGGGDAFLQDKSVKWGEITIDHVTSLFDKAGLCKCSKRGCNNMAFDPKTVDTNRKGVCESCFIGKLNADFQKAAEKRQKKERDLDAKRKAEGYTHKTTAWVHPKAGGDDYQLVIHTIGHPGDTEIKKLLKKRGSAVDTDYRIETL